METRSRDARLVANRAISQLIEIGFVFLGKAGGLSWLNGLRSMASSTILHAPYRGRKIKETKKRGKKKRKGEKTARKKE